MSDISFLAVPNIVGMRFAWYIQVFGVVLLFGFFLFFVLYFRIRHRRGKKLVKQLVHFDQRAQDMEKMLVLDNLRKSSGKELVVLFIDYLERFVTNKPYANFMELLEPQGFTPKEAEELAKTLYTDTSLPKTIEHKIVERLTKGGGKVD